MKTPHFKNRDEKGQVLIMALLIMAVLLIAILLLTDIQRIIRGKITVMSGIDAAAITGAVWQKHTLNIIGELNLIKACTVLITDPSYGIGNSKPERFVRLNTQRPRFIAREIIRMNRQRKQLERSAKLLTQMQARISFVGPLIGFGAAQQAAKNNRMPSNESCNDYLEALLSYVRNDDYYGDEDFVPQVFHDYAWRQPYGNMLEKLIASRIAVGTNAEHFDVTSLDSTTLQGRALQYWIILDAIECNDWCVLSALLTKDMDYSGKWWGDIKLLKNDKFLGCSEILPIHTDYVTGRAGESIYRAANKNEKEYISKYSDGKTPLANLYDRENVVDENGVLNLNDTDWRLNPLPDITWCIFDTNKWKAYPDALTAAWEEYTTGRFKVGTDYYSGAISYFSVQVPDRTITGQYVTDKISLGKKTGSSRLSGTTTHHIRFDATAKPFGHLTDKSNSVYHPHIAGLILPVFDKVAMIPVALERASGFQMTDYDWMIFLTKYLPALGTVDSIDAVEGVMDASHFTRIKDRGWHDLIKKLDDPKWRQQGIAWLDTPVWKFEPRTRVIGNNSDGTPITETYYERVQDGSNRDHCNDWVHGTVSRWGPGHLH